MKQQEWKKIVNTARQLLTETPNVKKEATQDDIEKLILEEVALNEAKKYPTQQSAEYVLEWSQGIESLSSGGVDSEITALQQKADALRQKAWNIVFGDKSPWAIKISGKKRKVVWDDAKAKSLGI